MFGAHFYIFIGLSLIVFTKADGCKKKYPDAHYREFGCTPELDKDGCPKRYDCKNALEMLKDPKKCYFLGKQYNIGDHIDDKLTQPNCIAAAVCMKDSWRDFIYAQVDCAEFFGPNKLKEGCFRQYQADLCCSTGTVCPPFPEDLATCKVDGKILREGEKFYPENDDCLTCICQKGYSGKNEAPYCRPVSCGLGLVKAVQFRKGNIPIYLEKRNCCPIAWIEYDSEIFKNFGRKLEQEPDANTCAFGDRVFTKGDKFQVEKDNPNSPEVNCECQLPPRLTCFQKPVQ